MDPEGETRDVYVRLLPASRRNPIDVRSLPISVPPTGESGNTSRGTIPLAQVADVERSTGPAQIEHIDRDRVITVEANTSVESLNAVVSRIEEQLESIELPAGYSLSQGGNVEDQQEAFTRIFIALGVALGLMYLVLVVQFNSFVDPVSIMESLPLSLIGVMMALLITGDTINLMSLIGVILLMGIVAKNAILLIDFAKWSERDGKGREDAIVEAGRVRLRPILMTSLALIAGMMSVAIGAGEGADFRAPMGRAIVGGVITSTILTLLVIPTFYDILAEWRDRVRNWVAAHADTGDSRKSPSKSGSPSPSASSQ